MGKNLSKFAALVTTTCFALMSLQPVALAAKKETKAGALRVLSTTIGAEIRIDGNVVAKVPFEEDISLEPGTRSLEVFLRGYMKHEETITIESGQLIEVEVDLIAVEGVVLIDTGNVVDAIVEVDGQIIGSTPFDGQIPAGAHTLRIYKTGYVESLREIRIQAGKRYVLDFELREDIPVTPMPVATAQPLSPEFYQTWWFWTLTGVAVAGTVTGVAMGTQEGETVVAPFDHVITLPPPGVVR